MKKYYFLFLGFFIIIILILITNHKTIPVPDLNIPEQKFTATAVKQSMVPTPIIYQNKTIQNILNQVQDFFAYNKLVNGGIYQDVGGLEWKTKDGWYVNASSTSPSVTAYMLCKDKYKSQFKEVHAPMYNAIENIFINNQFDVNNQNTMGEYNENDSGDMGYSYDKAFEKGNVQCMIRGIPDCIGLPGGYGENPSFSIGVACTDKLAEAAQWQLPLLKKTVFKNWSIHERKDFGDFIVLSLSYDHVILHKESDGFYNVIDKSQEAPTCQLEDVYNFPKELRDFLGKCF